MIKLKNQIVEKVEMFQEKVTHLETMNARYLKIKATLLQVLKSSGISICSLKDLQ